MGPFLHNLRYALSLRPSPNITSFLPPNLTRRQILYYKWKSIPYPWRKLYFIGMDLERNEFWEYRDRLNYTRPRRTLVPWEGWGAWHGKGRDWVDYASGINPQWHQWLRALRDKPPTIKEQEEDMVRLELLKRNAKLADERWAAKGRLAGPAPEEEVEVWDGKGEKKVKRESVMKQRERQAVRVPV